MSKKLIDSDYELEEGAVWIAAKGFSVRIHETDEGIAVDIYKLGEEDMGAITSAYAFDSELDFDYIPEPLRVAGT